MEKNFDTNVIDFQKEKKYKDFMNEYEKRLIEEIENAKTNSLENKDAFSAGRYDGLKQALEILNKFE